MYYIIRSIVRYLFWGALAEAYLILPLLAFPHVPTHLVLAGEIGFGLIVWLVAESVSNYRYRYSGDTPIADRAARELHLYHLLTELDKH